MAEDDGPRDEDEAGWAAPGTQAREPADHAAEPTGPSAPPPAPPAPPPPGAAPVPPPAPPSAGRPRRVWLFVLLAVASVGILAAIAGSVLFVDRTLPPYEAAHDFVNHVIDGDSSAATALLCTTDRESSERALSVVRQSFGARPATITVNALTVDRTDDRATVEYNVNAKNDDFGDRTVELSLREERGEWRACPSDGLISRSSD